MSSLRIRLDLSDFIHSVESKRLMFLDTHHVRTITDLEAKIRDEHGECGSSDLLLFMDDGFLIPTWEPIQVLQPGDLIKVIQQKKLLGQTSTQNSAIKLPKKRKRSVSKSQDESNIESNIETSAKKAKILPRVFAAKLKKNGKKKKKKRKSSILNQKVAEEESSSDDDMPLLKKPTRHHQQKQKVKHKTPSSSSEESDEPTNQKARSQAKTAAVVNQLKAQESSSDDSSSSSDDDTNQKTKQVVADNAAKEQTDDSSSSDSSSDTECSKKQVKAVPQKQAVAISKANVKNTKESSDDSSSSNSSSENEASNMQIKAVQAKKIANAVNAKESSSGDSSSSDSEATSNKEAVSQRVPPQKAAQKPQKAQSSSSDSSSESRATTAKPSDAKVNEEKISRVTSTNQNKPTENISKNENDASNGQKRKRKRKRKNKNKNKLPASEMPCFEEPEVNKQVYNVQSVQKQQNSRIVFTNEANVENSEVHQTNQNTSQADNYSAEDIQKLYAMSRPAAASTPQQSANISNNQQKGVSNSPYQHNFQPRVLSLDELVKKKGGAGKQAVSTPPRKLTENSQTNGTEPNGQINPKGYLAIDTSKDVYSNESYVIKNPPNVTENARSDHTKNPGNEEAEKAPNLPIDYASLPPADLEAIKINDVIAFKMIEMSERYTPEMSDFKKGKVIGRNENNISLEILDGATNRYRAGRFELNPDEETGEENTVLQLNIRDLIDPKIIKKLKNS